MKKAVVVIVAFATVAFFAYRYYNKPHRSIDESAGIEIDAPTLFSAFELNEREANTKYLDQIVLVRGIVSSVSQNQDGKQVIILQSNDPMFGVSCTLNEPVPAVESGQTLTIKGFCKGFLSDVVLTECKVVE